jgi:hypothetical protein
MFDCLFSNLFTTRVRFFVNIHACALLLLLLLLCAFVVDTLLLASAKQLFKTYVRPSELWRVNKDLGG